MSPPRQFTPEQLRHRRNEQRKTREAKAAALGKVCIVSRCYQPARPLFDLCINHQSRKVNHGSPLAGTVAAVDVHRMQERVNALLDGYGYRKQTKLDAELVSRALAVVQKIAIAPGMLPLPIQRGKHDAEYALAVELHRLQHPPKSNQPPDSVVAKRNGRMLTPTTAREVFVAATSAWLLCLTPGAITASRHKSSPLPIFDTQASMELLIGLHVLQLRHYVYPQVYDPAKGKAVRCLSRIAKRPILAKKLLAKRLMTALGPMLSLMQAGVLQMMRRSKAQREQAQRQKETLVTVKKVAEVPQGPPVFSFPITEES